MPIEARYPHDIENNEKTLKMNQSYPKMSSFTFINVSINKMTKMNLLKQANG